MHGARRVHGAASHAQRIEAAPDRALSAARGRRMSHTRSRATRGGQPLALGGLFREVSAEVSAGRLGQALRLCRQDQVQDDADDRCERHTRNRV